MREERRRRSYPKPKIRWQSWGKEMGGLGVWLCSLPGNPPIALVGRGSTPAMAYKNWQSRMMDQLL
jgi:hypothetical protein